MHTNLPIYLASNSPRRKELLTKAGLNFTVIPSDAKEESDASDPKDYAMDLAYTKAADIAGKQALTYSAKKDESFLVIGADTVVAVGTQILGKPTSIEDAYTMIRSLSGRTHSVYTGVCIIFYYGSQSHIKTFYDRTDVTFTHMTQTEIVEYLSTPSMGSWADKAGAYGIQEPFGIRYITGIHGDYNNVVGLPVSKLLQELKELTISR